MGELLEAGSFSQWGEVKELAESHKTLCDYDGALPMDLRPRVRALRRCLGVPITRIRLDRTARGFHMVLHWAREWTPLETVAIQAILGSDSMRESLNLRRARLDPQGASPYWNILYARKHHVEIS